MKYMFLNYPNHHPYMNGYYLVHYYNFQQQEYLYKRMYWDNANKRWHFPSPSAKDLSGVYKFAYNSRTRYYTGNLDFTDF